MFGRGSEPSVRGVGDCRGARSGGRHGARLAQARTGRVRRLRPRCWCSTISSRYWTRRRWSRNSGRRSPSLRVLVTSRAPLRVRSAAAVRRGTTRVERGRRTRGRPPISRARPRCSSSWNGFGTCNLAFASRPPTGPTVTAICQRLDALPLALELAAPWIKAANRGGFAPPTRARRPALGRRSAAICPNASRR